MYNLHDLLESYRSGRITKEDLQGSVRAETSVENEEDNVFLRVYLKRG